MSGMSKIMECVPNFSEGRNPENIEKIVALLSQSVKSCLHAPIRDNVLKTGRYLTAIHESH